MSVKTILTRFSQGLNVTGGSGFDNGKISFRVRDVKTIQARRPPHFFIVNFVAFTGGISLISVAGFDSRPVEEAVKVIWTIVDIKIVL